MRVVLAERLLDRVLVRELDDVDLLGLPEAVDAPRGLRLGAWVRARLEEVDARRGGQCDADRRRLVRGDACSGERARAIDLRGRADCDVFDALGANFTVSYSVFRSESDTGFSEKKR